ncbi:MAG: S-ribosylhomocysteine lyase [Clostridia bacterium]|nr:S-ribosylhomocysteine lyase [Clostridia bacterium]
MNKIESFKVDHIKLKTGLYVSRKDNYNGTVATTFDIRMVKPYKDDVIDIRAMHTIEHLGATYFRNSKFKNEVIYFGPMGCQTGFYLVLFGDYKSEDIFDFVVDMCDFIINFDGEIPGASKIECGNYLSHDLIVAKNIAKKYKDELVKYRNFLY